MEAQAIEAAAPDVIAAAIAARRQQIRDEASREVAWVEKALAAMEDQDGRQEADACQRFERVVEQIVAAVLGETAGP